MLTLAEGHAANGTLPLERRCFWRPAGSFSPSKVPLRYNKPESDLNPDFWAVGDPAGPLAVVLRGLG